MQDSIHEGLTNMEMNANDLAVSDSSIRQIALLLHSLPERTHRVLIGQLAENQRDAVANALASIQDVDAFEQHRVLKKMLEELLSETESVERVESEIHDEIQIGRARVTSKVSKSFRSASAPGTPATVTSTAGTSTSAHVSVGSDVATNKSLNGRTHDPDSYGRRQSCIRLRYAQTQAAGVLADRPAESFSAEPPPVKLYAPAKPQSEEAVPASMSNSAESADELAERIDRYLVQLDPERLCSLLGRVTTKQAFLVLCGLPNDVAESALALLPRRQANQVRREMRQMGRLQLSEIDHA
ncbi:MAG: FliG C-terminal domain-containing protein, partial [Planctomycetota bacterium]